MLHRNRAFPIWLLSLSLVVAGAAPGGGEKEFEEALRVVERTLASGKGKKAKELLLAELEARRESGYLFYHLSEIQDDLRRATFWSTNTKPDPKSLITGELLSWSASSGQIKLRYKLKSGDQDSRNGTGGRSGESVAAGVLGDFARHREVWIHPLMFDGPFTVEIKGNSYPALSEPARSPTIVVCGDWSGSTCVVFGLASVASGTYVPARIIQIEGEDASVLDGTEYPVQYPGAPFAAKVAVSASSVTAYMLDQRILSAARSGPVDGRIAFANFPSATEILITGKVTPSWLMNVVDSAVQERWSAFEKSYKPESDLPTWFREKAFGPATGETPPDAGLRVESAAGKEHVTAFFKLLAKGDSSAALDLVGKAPAGELTEGTRCFLQAQALASLGRADEAHGACSTACVIDPDCLPARRMLVSLDFSRKSIAEVVEDARAVVANFPHAPGPYVDLAEYLMIGGKPEDAQALVRKAIDSGIPASTLERTQELVARALRGPLWSKSYEYKSEHYTVISDMSQKACFDAATLLERFYTKFNLHFRRVQAKEKRIFRVFLFSGKSGYESYTKDLTGRESKNTAGMYSLVVKQLLIWNLPDSESITKTIRHEGFHQYLDQLASGVPRWLNEGLASYYEGSKLVKGVWSDGEVPAEFASLLEKNPLVPLKEFLRMGPSAFMDEKRVGMNYAESWAFVHFLLSSGPENKKLLDRFLDALISGTRSSEALEQVFPETTTARLEPEFAVYARGLH